MGILAIWASIRIMSVIFAGYQRSKNPRENATVSQPHASERIEEQEVQVRPITSEDVMAALMLVAWSVQVGRRSVGTPRALMDVSVVKIVKLTEEHVLTMITSKIDI